MKYLSFATIFILSSLISMSYSSNTHCDSEAIIAKKRKSDDKCGCGKSHSRMIVSYNLA